MSKLRKKCKFNDQRRWANLSRETKRKVKIELRPWRDRETKGIQIILYWWHYTNGQVPMKI